MIVGLVGQVKRAWDLLPQFNYIESYQIRWIINTLEKKSRSGPDTKKDMRNNENVSEISLQGNWRSRGSTVRSSLLLISIRSPEIQKQIRSVTRVSGSDRAVVDRERERMEKLGLRCVFCFSLQGVTVFSLKQ